MQKNLLALLLVILFVQVAKSQCGSPITSFPYIEDFEISPSWISGGTANDWAWGTPTKAVINTAGSGVKCWIVGGLSGTTYNSSERSYIQSPCFDFTSLSHPYIEFKLYRECEYHYDGSNLQYSLDLGVTWRNVGAFGDAVTCLDSNWYNYASINYLSGLASPTNGWCGNSLPSVGICVGGSGSFGWVNAKHCMPYLGGRANVIFRFTFGAGTTCNSYDGIAIDNVIIKEAPAIAVTATATCVAGSRYNFNETSTYCPSTYLWNFGDPTTGASNSSALQNPSHTFSAPGSYTVTHTDSSRCSGVTISTIVVHVLGVNVTVTNTTCPTGATGTATAVVDTSTGIGPFTYAWSTTPPQTTATATGLSAGTYTVTVSQAGSCAVVDTVVVSSPAPFAPIISTTPTICTAVNGTASIVQTGGTPGYRYLWTTGGDTTSTKTHLSAGSYTVIITDQNGCVDTATALVGSAGGGFASIINSHNDSCFGGNTGSATVAMTGGTAPFNYNWIPTGQTTATAINLFSGHYVVVITDSSGCISSDSINITAPSLLSISPLVVDNPTCANNNGFISIQATGGTPSYNYSWNPPVSVSASANFLLAGNYKITVIDSNGCTQKDSFTLVIPPAFTIALDNIGDTCNRGVGSLLATIVGGRAPFTYAWSPIISTASSVHFLKGNQTYILTVTDSIGCVGVDSAEVDEYGAIPVLSLGSDTVFCFDGGRQITISPGVFSFYTWQDGSHNPTYVIVQPGIYNVVVQDVYGCAASDTIQVTEECASDLVVPTAFSPNGDGINDLFGAYAKGIITNFNFAIYNRWGEVVFQSTDITNWWDGNYKSREQPLGAFVWVVQYTNSAGQPKIKKGNLTLLR
jgi:gliding motility-associated-like protein